MTREDRYQLHAYVCGEMCVQWSNNEGWSTFRNIYLKRPEDCRYAVAGTYSGDVITWDLFDARLSASDRILPPEPTRYLDLDAAIMATQLTYNNGGNHGIS